MILIVLYFHLCLPYLSKLFPFFFGKNEPITEPEPEDDADIESFPLLELPNELILIVLRFLPVRDRLRARVNRRLFELEAAEEYKAKHLVISRRGEQRRVGVDEDVRMKLIGPSRKYIEGVKKLASNLSVEILSLRCEFVPDRVLLPFISSIRAFRVFLDFGRREMAFADILAGLSPPTGNEAITDANLEDWIGGTKFLDILGGVALTGDRLHQLFIDMDSGRSSLLSLRLTDGSKEDCRRLLELLGITRVGGRIQSTRRDVEIFEERNATQSTAIIGIWLIVIGSKMKITLSESVLDEDGFHPHNEFTIERHNEDGTVPAAWHEYYSYYLSIENIRMEFAMNKMGRVPVTYIN